MPGLHLEYAVELPTAWGRFTALIGRCGVRRLFFPEQVVEARLLTLADRSLSDPVRLLAECLADELSSYIAGSGRVFSVAADTGDEPEFYGRVWQVLRRVPYGQTVTYAELAARAGNPRAARAAGQACGANPVPLLIPCHRVLAAHGIGGFSAGAGWKSRLLELEAR